MSSREGLVSNDDHSTETEEPRAAYSVKEVAQLLGVSERHTRTEIKNGRIKSFRLGRRVLVSREMLQLLTDGEELS